MPEALFARATHQPRERPLAPLADFGSNPGNLDGHIHVPAAVSARPPLVVVLHGCTQTAASYDLGAGWSAVADDHGFIVLFPEQKRANNPNLCFNWFSPGDAQRDRGEALSIAQMIETVHQRYGTDPSRVFITGLSAGGAMTSVMLATYPDLFAGGGIIAGLPYGTAKNVPQALERMRGHGLPDGAALGDLVRDRSHFTGPWPTLSVWHGTSDSTVDPANGRAVVAQWRQLHGLDDRPSHVEKVGKHTRRAWSDKGGREVIEEYLVGGMPHGTPLSTLEPGSSEVAGPHMVEAGISSTRRLIEFWGLDAVGNEGRRRIPEVPERFLRSTDEPIVNQRPTMAVADGITRTINDALRAAGLLQ